MDLIPTMRILAVRLDFDEIAPVEGDRAEVGVDDLAASAEGRVEVAALSRVRPSSGSMAHSRHPQGSGRPMTGAPDHSAAARPSRRIGEIIGSLLVRGVRPNRSGESPTAPRRAHIPKPAS